MLKAFSSFFSFTLFLTSLSWGFQSVTGNPVADTLHFELRPVTVTASRLDGTDLNVPVAVTVLSRYRIQGGQQQLVLNEALAAIPGLYTMNSENFAQDMRVSIRGFGARAAFGIRGIKILVDGIPESTPDGQAQVDNIDLGFIDRIEVLRGPVSALYGNASGGVISFSSSEPPEASYLDMRVSTGDFGFQQIQLKVGQQRGPFSYIMNFSRNQADGFREHSAMKNSVVNGKLRWEIDPNLSFTFLTNYAVNPLANDPGALTKDQVVENRSSARDRNVQYNSGESVSQFRIALVAEKKFSQHQTLQTRAYFTTRDFENRL
ncbi:MAG TPA: TonB-dependent receptor, partial [Candidatus Marinimicrobia bacterium]|nr:TonB-dependent receptor [Candidatus Neomarinimicrobiota bacterium]